LQQRRSIVSFRAPVETEIFISTVQQEVFHDIHNLRHLEKHQDLSLAPSERKTYPVTSSFEFRKDTIKEFELSARSPKEIVADAVRIHCVLDFFEDKWMITDLLQLHHRIVQPTESFATKLVMY
jgi:hypothetical protein